MSKRYGRALAAMVAGLTAMQHPWRRAYTRLRVANALHQRHRIATRHGELVFVSTHQGALLYPRSFAEREPETLEWIDGFDAPATFWDVGANIGMFALYAALRPEISVLAFEPSPASFAALARNIEANGSGERIRAFCVAFSDRTRLGSLNMSATHPGNSFNSFDSTEDCFGRELAVDFSQATIGFSIDAFRRTFGLPAPDYLKIDVDGIEAAILAGAAETLADPALRSVLVELEYADTERNRRIIAPLTAAGFTLIRRGVNESGSANGIFVRDQ